MVNGILGNQQSYASQLMGWNPSPYSNGAVEINGPWGHGTGLVIGAGSFKVGPGGISAGVPFPAGYGPTGFDISSSLGAASPFGLNYSHAQGIGSNSFGSGNPFDPTLNTPWEVNLDEVRASGAFGAYHTPLSRYSGAYIPETVGRLPGGHNMEEISASSGLASGALFSPAAGGVGGSVPGQPYGSAQHFAVQGKGYSTEYDVITDGIAKLALHGNSDMPAQYWGSGGNYVNPYGIFEVSVGPGGGYANAGINGTQAAGDAVAIWRNPINPAMIISKSSPHLNSMVYNYGWQTS